MTAARDNLIEAALRLACEEHPDTRATHILVVYADGTATWVELPAPPPPTERPQVDAHLDGPDAEVDSPHAWHERENDPPVVKAIFRLLDETWERMTYGQIVTALRERHPRERGFGESNIEGWLNRLLKDGRLHRASKEQGERDGFGKGIGDNLWVIGKEYPVPGSGTVRNDSSEL